MAGCAFMAAFSALLSERGKEWLMRTVPLYSAELKVFNDACLVLQELLCHLLNSFI